MSEKLWRENKIVLHATQHLSHLVSHVGEEEPVHAAWCRDQRAWGWLTEASNTYWKPWAPNSRTRLFSTSGVEYYSTLRRSAAPTPVRDIYGSKIWLARHFNGDFIIVRVVKASV